MPKKRLARDPQRFRLGPVALSQKSATSSQSEKPGYCGDGCIGNMHHQPIFEETADNRKQGR
jgi:hypothetical protein